MLARKGLKSISNLDDSSVALFHIRGCFFRVLSTLHQPCGDVLMASPHFLPSVTEIGNPVQDQRVPRVVQV